MKIFISSVITDYEEFRDAVGRAIASLGYEVIRAEDFGASAQTPQQACLSGVRAADATILVLGARYGARQPSGLSATHEEYREARRRQPVLVFVQMTEDREAAQVDFVREAREWNSGNLTVTFSTAEDLRNGVTRELHRLGIMAAARPVDEAELRSLAESSIGETRSSFHQPSLVISTAAGPRQEILRPSEVEDPELARRLQQRLIFGPEGLFVVEAGIQTQLVGGSLVLSQTDRSVRLNGAGDILVTLPAVQARDTFDFAALIEEDIEAWLERGLGFVAWLLNDLDPTNGLAGVAVTCAVTEASYHAWRTRAEQEASPRAGTIGSGRDGAIVALTPAVRSRPELTQRASELAHDLMVLVRREIRG